MPQETYRHSPVDATFQSVNQEIPQPFYNHLAPKDPFIIEESPYEILYQMILNFGSQ